MSVEHLNDETFEQFVADGIAVVDFWASWCAPCKQFAPIFEQFASDNSNDVKCGKVNVDECFSIAERYGISAIPTICFFKNGEMQKKEVGFCSGNELADMLNEIK